MRLEKITAKGADHLYRHPKTGVIYFRQFRAGFGEVCRSTRTKNLNEAKAAADHFKRDFLGRIRQSFQRKTALEEFDLWIERKRAANKSPATMTSILSSRKYLKFFLNQMLLVDVNAEWWESNYIPTIRSITSQSRRFFNDRKWLSMFLKQMVEDGKIPKAAKLINPDAKTKVGRVLSNDEIQTLLVGATGDLYQMIIMASTMGMRRLEITNLRWDRVNLKRKTISLKAEDTKIRKPRAFKISAAALPGLLARAKNGSPYVFPNKDDKSRTIHKDGFTGQWKRLKEKSEITARFHDLRHTFLTNAFKAAGSNLALICHYAGLSLEEAERTYLHFDEDDTAGIADLVTYE